ncbi:MULTISPECIES: cupin domain-containing protein [Haloferacaceae]|uniref:Cupin domain-containing protein n=1 Tax=Halorubrum glutamatedens TaxID=2707018 RepID=A0ABD5QPF0_9EURY|nr:cupin domain-containing protein [Halobellus captivus]
MFHVTDGTVELDVGDGTHELSAGDVAPVRRRTRDLAACDRVGDRARRPREALGRVTRLVVRGDSPAVRAESIRRPGRGTPTPGGGRRLR